MASYDLALINAKRAYDGLRAQLTKVKNTAKENAVVESGVGTVLGTVTAFGAGYVDGRYPDKTLFGMPVSLVIGAGATVLSASGYAGKESKYVSAVGNGALGAYAALKGHKAGVDAATAPPK